MKKQVDFNSLTRYNQHLLIDMSLLKGSHIRYNKYWKEWCYYFKISTSNGEENLDMWVAKDTISKDRLNFLLAGGALFTLKDKYDPKRVYKYILNKGYKL